MIGFFVEGEDRASALNRLIGSPEIIVRPVGRMHGDRFESIIVARYKDREMPESELRAYSEWLQWLPTRLAPGCQDRIFFL